MDGQAALKEDINKLGLEMAGLKPLVEGMHGYMPRITAALEELARITETLKSNAEDHKRIHYRITGVENEVRGIETDLRELTSSTATNQGRLEERFNLLREEHLECMTVKRVEKVERRKSLWIKIKTKIEERIADIVVWLLISFTVWTALEHMKTISAADIINALKK